MTKYTMGLGALAVAMCSVAACAQSPVEPVAGDDVAAEEQSIIGGRNSTTDYCVAELIVHNPGVSTGTVCTCTFIATDTCLTAAHCVDPRTVGSGKVFEIHTETNAPLSVEIGTSTAFDPQWNPANPNGGHDFGIVRIGRPYPFICNRGGFNASMPVFLVGYGASTHSGTGIGTRRVVSAPIVSSNSLLIEAGSAAVGACPGDFGGPAIQWYTSPIIRPVVAGVIAFGTDRPPQVCVGTTFSGRLDSATSWVDQQVPCGNGVCQSGETTSSCPFDCHVCGDGICAWGPEDSTNCFSDCHCGNGVCDPGESSSTCWNDCPDSCLDSPPTIDGIRHPRC